MKVFYWFALFVVIVSVGCQEQSDGKPSDALTYNLFRAGYEPIHGTVTFTESETKAIAVEITLENTDARFDFPAHLHFGTISEVGELAIRLEDVKLSSGEIFTYDMLSQFNGSVKIHLAEGLFGYVVLAYGNVGANENYLSDGLAVCVGH
jgi:ethanolamine utilization microcompartment shell protein EutS